MGRFMLSQVGTCHHVRGMNVSWLLPLYHVGPISFWIPLTVANDGKVWAVSPGNTLLSGVGRASSVPFWDCQFL